MNITTPLSDELERYLDLSGLELKLTAQNMANVDVPGYRTVGFNFANAMKRSIGEVMAERRSGQVGVNSGQEAEAAANIVRVGGLVERPDGNNVSMDRSSMKMAQAQLQFDAGTALLKNEFTLVTDAINEDK